MRSINSLLILLSVLFCLSSCYKEKIIFAAKPNENLELPLILAFDDRDCFFDEESNGLRYSISEDSILNFSPFIEFQEYANIEINNVPLTNGAINNLGTVKIGETYDVSITIDEYTEHFSLSFTTFPSVRIISRNKVNREIKILAHMTIHSPSNNTTPINSFINIEYRGNSSLLNPKKSYGFTFLKDMNIKNEASVGLFGWKENHNWILDAVYNDQAKFRNKLSFEIWKSMNPTQHVSIQSKFVEVYFNSSYLGLFCLNEHINAEQLDLLNSDGLLYKTVEWSSGTTFDYFSAKQIPEYTDLWDGWEQQYPVPTEKIKWKDVYKLKNWAINESDETFLSELENHIDLENIIDYYLFINLVGAFDNHGKNMFWVKNNADAPFYIIPWDLDSSWGRDWDADPLLPVRVKSEDNKLFKRLLTLDPNNFKDQLRIKWNNLRSSSWSENNIKDLLDNYFEQLVKNKVTELENIRWNTTVDLAQEQVYIHSWLNDQLALLDSYFNNL